MWARCERRFNHFSHTPQTRWRKLRSALRLPMTAKYPKCPSSLRLSAVHCSRTGSCRYWRHHSAIHSPKAVCRGLLLHHPISFAGHGPVMSEAQQVEGVGPGARIAAVGRHRNPPVRSPEINQPGLLRVKRQAVLRQPLRQHVEDSSLVQFVLEDDNNIICITNENRAAGKSLHDLPCKPFIKHLMQVDVRQDWGNYTAVWPAGLPVLSRSSFIPSPLPPLPI